MPTDPVAAAIDKQTQAIKEQTAAVRDQTKALDTLNRNFVEFVQRKGVEQNIIVNLGDGDPLNEERLVEIYDRMRRRRD